MTKFCLCGCGEPLRGKQTKFASDACRMRYTRQQKSEREQTDLFANRSVLPERQVKVRLRVVVIFSTQGGEDMDGRFISRRIRSKMAEYLAAWLAGQHPGDRILAVRIDKEV